jgi:perosamine synthetase
MKQLSEISMSGPDVTEEDIAIVNDMLRNGWYGESAYSYVERFEHDFATFHGRKYALMTPNCTSAIHLALSSVGIKAGDEVIVPDVTWIASAAPVKYQNATPVFADVNSETWCLDVKSISTKITDKTKAVIVVDLYGNMPDLDSIEKLCKEKGIILIEDSAEALGSVINNRRAGSFGEFSVFSFHRTKTLTTGEGGMLLTDDEKLYNRCKFLRDHGRAPGTYFNTEVTFKYMPSNLAAALGFAQLQRIDQLVGKKRWIWKEYSRLFSDIPEVKLNPEPKGVFNSVWSTVLLADLGSGLNRDSIMKGFTRLGIPTRPFFYPLSSLPAFSAEQRTSDEPNLVSIALSQQGVCLPSALNLNERHLEIIYNGFLSILHHKG